MLKIIISNDIKDLTGKGIEYLTDNEGNVIAGFVDGNFERIEPINSKEDTIPLAA